VKLAAIVGGAGALAVLGVSFLLVLEKGRHADTRAELADVRTQFAEYREQVAESAAAAAASTAAAVAAAQDELDRQLAAEGALRNELADLRRASSESRTEADRLIARLRSENEELAAWADTVIPGAWLEFMRGRAGSDTATAAEGDRSPGDSVPVPSR